MWYFLVAIELTVHLYFVVEHKLNFFISIKTSQLVIDCYDRGIPINFSRWGTKFDPLNTSLDSHSHKSELN